MGKLDLTLKIALFLSEKYAYMELLTLGPWLKYFPKSQAGNHIGLGLKKQVFGVFLYSFKIPAKIILAGIDFLGTIRRRLGRYRL